MSKVRTIEEEESFNDKEEIYMNAKTKTVLPPPYIPFFLGHEVASVV